MANQKRATRLQPVVKYIVADTDNGTCEVFATKAQAESYVASLIDDEDSNVAVYRGVEMQWETSTNVKINEPI